MNYSALIDRALTPKLIQLSVACFYILFINFPPPKHLVRCDTGGSRDDGAIYQETSWRSKLTECGTSVIAHHDLSALSDVSMLVYYVQTAWIIPVQK